MTGPINSDKYSEMVRKAEDLDGLLCPIHKSLDERDELVPFDNCIACIRNERDELRARIAELDAMLNTPEGSN